MASAASLVILITGANRGIGLAIAQLLAERRSESTIIISSRIFQNAVDAAVELRRGGSPANFQPLQLDVTDDESILNCVRTVEQRWGKLDVLVNNAGFARPIADDRSDYRAVWNQIYNVNVTSVGLLCDSFAGLLSHSTDGRVVNISSGRASFSRVASGTNPPTANMAYSTSKVALCMLTIELSKTYPTILFQLANPGHCRTSFNGYRGKRDPLVGAFVAAELALASRQQYVPGFWEYDESEGMRIVPW